MTRINCVPPSTLHHKHLLAEYRELPRVFELAKRAHERGESIYDKRNPTEYTLGTGHVRFFYPRLGYLRTRFKELVLEMRARGYNPMFTDTKNVDVPSEWWGEWEPMPEALDINKRRIEERSTWKEV